jgi:hypothetical protein
MFCNPRQLKKYQIHGIRLIEGIWKMRQTTGDDHEVCYPKRGDISEFPKFFRRWNLDFPHFPI